MKGLTCCFECSIRFIGCYGSCQTYIEEEAKHDKTKEMMKKQKIMNI